MTPEQQKILATDVYNFFCSRYLPDGKVEVADVAFVFARNVKELAHVGAALFLDGFVTNVLVTGGVGKDSGDLPKLGLTEAAYLAALMYAEDVPADAILVESKATNGGENSRFGTKMIVDADIRSERIILVVHPSNGVRVLAAHTLEARKMGFTADYQLVACEWFFNPDSEEDQKLVISECLRLIEWPLRTVDGKPAPWADHTNIPADLAHQVLSWKADQAK